MVRTSLVVAIYDKTLSLNQAQLNETAALSLITTDTQSICSNMKFVDSLLMSPIEIALEVFLMAQNMGVACLATVLISLTSTLLGLKIATRTEPLQKLLDQATQERVTLTTPMLNSSKGIKMLGLVDMLTQSIQNLRFQELEKSKAARLFVV